MFIPGQANTLINPSALTVSGRGTLVTASATANTKGAWVLTASGPTYGGYTPDALMVCLSGASNSGGYLVDIGVASGAGSEYVIAADLCKTLYQANSAIVTYILPVRVPFLTSGGGIYARAQCTVGSSTIDVHTIPIHTGVDMGSGGRIVPFGVSGQSRGVTIDSGAVASTKSAWVQLAASSGDYPIQAMGVHVGSGADNNRSGTGWEWGIDIGIGAAASETVVIPNLVVGCNATVDFNEAQIVSFFPCSIPPSTRIAGRSQCPYVTAGDRVVDIITYALVGAL